METRKLDPAYHTVARDDFAAMIDVGRYATRSSHFEEIIDSPNEHFGTPEDTDYMTDSERLPADTPIVPLEMVPELQSAVADKLNEKQQIELANESARWSVSNILHGEQGALSL